MGKTFWCHIWLGSSNGYDNLISYVFSLRLWVKFLGFIFAKIVEMSRIFRCHVWLGSGNGNGCNILVSYMFRQWVYYFV